MACEPANQACVQLSCTCAAKGTCFYCCKYVSKDSNKLMATASMLVAAEQHVQANPSRAADAQTSSVRAAKHLLTNTVNRVVSAMEVSDQQVRDIARL
jgi:hypothetical protein